VSEDPTPGWRFLKAVVEGDPIEIDGVNLWKRRRLWVERGETIVVAHPLYPRQRRELPVREVEGPEGPIVFAAGELTGLVWGYFVPDPTLAAGFDLAGLVGDSGTLLFSPDPQRTASFYARLGFVETYRAFEDAMLARVDLELDGRALAIVLATAAPAGVAEPSTAGRGGVSLRADDVNAAFAALVSAGVPGLRAPAKREGPWGRRLVAWVEDPDGRAIELVQRT